MQEISKREKLFAVLGFIILLTALPLSLLVVRQRVSYRGRASNVVSVPKQVMVTNVHAKGFSVSWITDNQTSGSVLNGSTEIQDARGAADNYYTHYVDVLNLNPETDYTFKIKSGPDTYGYTSLNGGTWEKNLSGGMSVRTAKQIGDENQLPSASNPYGAYSTETNAFGPCPNGTVDASGNPVMNQACFRPYPLWGEVKNSSGQGVASALVYAAIKETPDSKYALSAITDSGGKWSIELANQYTNDFQSYLAYTPSSDKINVAAYSNQGTATANNLGMVSVLSTDSSMNAPSPVVLTLSGGSTITVTNPPGTGTSLNFQINKVQLQGRADATMNFTVKFRAAGSANTSAVLGTANVMTNSTGVGNGSVNLAAGNYDVYLVPSESYLSAKLSNVAMQAGKTLDFTNGAMINGRGLCADINDQVGKALCAGDIKTITDARTDEIDGIDYDRVLARFEQNYPEADFNKNGKVDGLDYDWVLANFEKKGADRP